MDDKWDKFTISTGGGFPSSVGNLLDLHRSGNWGLASMLERKQLALWHLEVRRQVGRAFGCENEKHLRKTVTFSFHVEIYMQFALLGLKF